MFHAIISGKIMHTLVLIKPDAFERNLVGYIITKLEQYRIVNMKTVYMDTWWISRHYRDHKYKSYYNALHNFMSSGPTLALEVDCYAEDMIDLRNQIREELGVKNPRNLIHSSDPLNVSYELNLWFPDVHTSD